MSNEYWQFGQMYINEELPITTVVKSLIPWMLDHSVILIAVGAILAIALVKVLRYFETVAKDGNHLVRKYAYAKKKGYL